MPKFLTTYEKISITVGIDLGELQNFNFCTIYLWNGDWDLRTAIWEFVQAHEKECKLVTRHCDKEEPHAIYHHEDLLINSYTKIHTHLKYYNNVGPEEFNDLLELIVKEGGKSLRNQIEDINKWKKNTLDRFSNWYKENKKNSSNNLQISNSNDDCEDQTHNKFTIRSI